MKMPHIDSIRKALSNIDYELGYKKTKKRKSF